MSEDTDQEKTEAATPHRLEEARKQGQIPRSREINTLVVTLTGAIVLLVYGNQFVASLGSLMHRGLAITREQAHDSMWLGRLFSELSLTALLDFTPLFVWLVIASLLAPMALGGWSFSVEAMGFKWNRLNPISGLTRMLSWHGLTELGKAFVKFLLMSLVGIWLLNHHAVELLRLGQGDLMVGLGRLGHLLAWGFLILATVLILVAAADAPFQLWEHAQGLKMTRQQVRDEAKETEGRPEVKARIRQMQRQIAQRRMMAEVPKADVLLLNPTHYAVALRYDSDRMGAPRLVAKGADFIALRMREVAKEAKVLEIIAPALTRALYYNVDLGKEVPLGLYQAVAQVLAFVYQVRKGGPAPGPNAFDNLPIPEDLRH